MLLYYYMINNLSTLLLNFLQIYLFFLQYTNKINIVNNIIQLIYHREFRLLPSRRV